METDNIIKIELATFEQKLANFDLALQEIRALIDQKFDHIEGAIENLESRINNLR
jgi:hypothetical protein